MAEFDSVRTGEETKVEVTGDQTAVEGQDDQGAGTTVTFGGVETFATNSIAGSTTAGSTTAGSTTGVLPDDDQIAGPSSKLPPIEKSGMVNIPSQDLADKESVLPPIEKFDATAPKININPDVVKNRDTITKPYLNAVVIGHVGSGKSTVSGRLIYECDAIDEELMTKFEREANQAGKSTFKYAWIMDKLQAERERGISIDTKLRRLETRQFYINVIDAPGHVDYVHNMITGASQADAAILVVSAKDGDFEKGVAHGGQTREHLQLAYTMGVKQVIVVVNKMDVTKPPYSQKRYNFVVQNVDLLVRKAGFETEGVVYVPISGWKGDNLVKRSENLNWFKMWQIERKSGGASGRTLLDALDVMERPPKMDKYPFRMAVHSVYKLGSVGVVAAGRIHTGFVKPGMAVTFGPADITTKVRAVQLHHDAVNEGYQGENVGLQIENLDVKDIRKGFLCGQTSKDPPKKVPLFTAQMVIVNHPGVIKKGYTPMIHIHTACVPVKFTELKEKCDRQTGGRIETNPSTLKAGDACVVDLTPMKPLCVESFFEYPSLGRFIIRDMKQTIAVGVVVNIPGRDPPQTDDDKWAVETVPFSRRPQTTGGRSVSFSVPEAGEFEKPSKNFSLLNDEVTFRTQSGKLETEL